MARNDPETAIITMYSGTHIDLLHPDPALIVIDDIAAGLSKINRFSGATFRPYTVAEHSLLGVEQIVPENRFKWFTHDFSEAYLNDVVGPLKNVLGMAFYRDLEAAWERVIAERFGIPSKGAKEVRSVDGRMLVTERRDLMGRRPLSTDRHKPFALHLAAAAPSQDWLQQNFLATFYALARDTEGALI
jgi:hypothetical protein